MQPIIIQLEEKYIDLVNCVSDYGYNGAVEPRCGNNTCQSELDHLLTDWLEGANDLRDMQAYFELKNAEFEQLLAGIFIADEVQYV
ncbi:hypothetical protein BCY75_09480 [Latilactobacillus curvatus]|uniref:hypothetical protein n=1 Tax=Latilactobacillus curvatus TaxID=28038 RepID=UPI000814C3C3|nr:hypothetical protein [Latilactobacillus curvatus]ANY14208.1 hypothetical protein BCY75_09480 [Latilactobacillus curvatus]